MREYLTSTEENALRTVAAKPRSWGHLGWMLDEFCHLHAVGLVEWNDKNGRCVVSISAAGREWLRCICPQVYDCQSPGTDPAMISNGCPATQHRNHAVRG